MLGKLSPCSGGPPILLLKPKLLVGRQSFCDIPLAYPSVSSRHCELELRDGYWHVRDLGSSNGTRVNDTVCQSQWLLPDDILSVARYRFVVLYAPASNRPPPLRAPAPLVGEATATAIKKSDDPNRTGTASVRVAGKVSGTARPFGRLIPCAGGDPIPLLKTRLLIGRHADCDIVLKSPGVSGHHCELEWSDAGWVVRDLGSKNGIRVDGVRCDSKRLTSGSILSIAGLRYELADSSRTEGAPQIGPSFAQSLLEKAGLSRPSQEPPDVRQQPGEEEDERRPRYSLDEPD